MASRKRAEASASPSNNEGLPAYHRSMSNDSGYFTGDERSPSPVDIGSSTRRSTSATLLTPISKTEIMKSDPSFTTPPGSPTPSAGGNKMSRPDDEVRHNTAHRQIANYSLGSGCVRQPSSKWHAGIKTPTEEISKASEAATFINVSEELKGYSSSSEGGSVDEIIIESRSPSPEPPHPRKKLTLRLRGLRPIEKSSVPERLSTSPVRNPRNTAARAAPYSLRSASSGDGSSKRPTSHPQVLCTRMDIKKPSGRGRDAKRCGQKLRKQAKGSKEGK